MRKNAAEEDIIPLAAKVIKQEYSDGEIIAIAPEAYGLKGTNLRIIAKHPLYIEMVRSKINMQKDMIRRILNFTPSKMEDVLDDLVYEFGKDQVATKQIMEDTGIQMDWQDIVISTQNHPIHREMVLIREKLVNFLKRTHYL